MLELYLITSTKIYPIKKLTPRDTIIVSDSESKKLYIYKGKDSLSLNEFESQRLYDRIMHKFLNSKIFLLNNLKIHSDKPTEISKVKKFINSHLQDGITYKIGKFLKRIFLFQGTRDRVKKFLDYEKSLAWRKKLSNLSNIWKLNLFNVISIFIIILLFIFSFIFEIIPKLNSSSNVAEFRLLLENFIITVLISVIILVVMGIVNLIFILFPIRFPLEPHSLTLFKDQEKTEG